MHTVSWGLVVAALRAMLRWRGGSAGSCTTWRGLGVCWVGVAVSWRVAGCCAPCWGGVGAGRGWALRATLKGRGGLAGSWRVLGRGGGESVGGGVLRAVLGWRGGRWRLGLACCVEAAWRVGGVLACRVGSVRWVGGGGVAGQDGGGSRARMGCNLQGEREAKRRKTKEKLILIIRPKVLCCVGAARWVGGGGVAGQDGGGSRARMGCNLQGLVLCWGGEVGWRWRGGGAGWGGSHEWAAISRVLRRVGVARWVGSGGVSEQDGGGSRAQMAVLRAVLGRRVGGGSMLQAMSGRRCWGRDEWKRLACTRGRQWPATLKPWDGPCGITAWW
ncbi:hypothetical protein EDB89DRAFT_1909081 [Lactarius sanguifluus]|nr:hypothetical protein EDB89DRAFT_1909081 [Lactarius sanguifluus]